MYVLLQKHRQDDGRAAANELFLKSLHPNLKTFRQCIQNDILRALLFVRMEVVQDQASKRKASRGHIYC